MAQITESTLKLLDSADYVYPLTASEQKQLAFGFRKWKEARPILAEMLEAWRYFSEYDVPIGMKERIEKVLSV